MENNNDSNIEVKLSPKGRYYWSIKIGFQTNLPFSHIPEQIKMLDEKLRQSFPKNTADIPSGSSGFKEVDEF